MGYVYEKGKGYRANVLLDSIGPSGKRITTWELRYPRMVHAELLTHRVFSRNSASSRAIPNERLIAQVLEEPAMPVWWGKNQSGMQAREELSGEEPTVCRGGCGLSRVAVLMRPTGFGNLGPACGGTIPGTHDFRSDRQIVIDSWLAGRDVAVETSRRLSFAGIHKQIANRVIEPWMFVVVIVTSTEWDNWFAQRDHSDAQPEIAYIATKMREAWSSSIPRILPTGAWHLPLVDRMSDADEASLEDRRRLFADSGLSIEDRKWISAGRCARVSYMTHDGVRDPNADVELARRLAASMPGHWSPFEHVAQAMADAGPSGNFFGWKQFRKEFENEHVGGRRL